jgi:protein subunit release factor A
VSDRGGARAEPLFRDEAGGHRRQRVPPNEKRDRVHTSTITVAVLPEPTEVEVRVAERDLEWSTCPIVRVDGAADAPAVGVAGAVRDLAVAVAESGCGAGIVARAAVGAGGGAGW